jgi:hypothetical protein
MNFLKRILNFLSLVNDDGALSVTTLGVYVVLVKLAMTPNWSLNEAGVLLVTLMNYAHKRHVGAQTQDDPQENQDGRQKS